MGSFVTPPVRLWMTAPMRRLKDRKRNGKMARKIGSTEARIAPAGSEAVRCFDSENHFVLAVTARKRRKLCDNTFVIGRLTS